MQSKTQHLSISLPSLLHILYICSGDPNRCDIRGQTPLHVAATYGNYEALEVLIQHRGNIWALDNSGLHPTKLAAKKHQLHCCRLLDSVAVQFESYNTDYVRKEQNKAVKEMEKRIKEMEKAAINRHRKKKEQRVRSNSESKGKRALHKQTTTSDSENFLLKNPNTEDDDDDDDEYDDEADSQIADLVTQSTKNTLRPLPKIHSGAMLNTLSDLARNPMRIDMDDLQASSSDPILVRPSRTNNSTPAGGSPDVGRVRGMTIGSIVPLQEIEIEHDSSLVTFLHSLDVLNMTQVLMDQRIDMESLALCTDEDLAKIGVLLGPRKKILKALQERKHLMSNPGEMIDSNF